MGLVEGLPSKLDNIALLFADNYFFWSAMLSLMIVFLSPFFYDAGDNYVIQLFVGQPPQIFFPLFPWIVYPLIGLTIGYTLQRRPFKVFQGLLYCGVFAFIIGGVISYVTVKCSSIGFYRTNPGETLMHVGIVMLVLWVWNKLVGKLRNIGFLELLNFCSQNITSIYLFQWVLICWLLPFIGYQTMNLFESLLTAMWISTMVFGFTYLFINHNKKYEHQ